MSFLTQVELPACNQRAESARSQRIAQQEIELAARIKNGDQKARAWMIKTNLRLVVKIAHDYSNLGLPLQIYFAEAEHTMESLADSVNEQLKSDGHCLLVVSEGFDVGGVGELHDDFGHIEYSSSRTTVAQQIVNYLNDNRLKAYELATAQVPGAIQRCVSLYASCVDIDEAYLVARHAVGIALKDGSGWMATILRKSTESYEVQYDKVPLKKVANSERHLPRNWISKNGVDVTDEFIRYDLPLIGNGNPDIKIINGLQRFARFNKKFIDRLTPEYQPVCMRV